MAAPTTVNVGVTFNFADETGVSGMVRRIVTDVGPAGTVINYLVETDWAGAGNELRTLWLTTANNVQAK